MVTRLQHRECLQRTRVGGCDKKLLNFCVAFSQEWRYLWGWKGHCRHIAGVPDNMDAITGRHLQEVAVTGRRGGMPFETRTCSGCTTRLLKVHPCEFCVRFGDVGCDNVEKRPTEFTVFVVKYLEMPKDGLAKVTEQAEELGRKVDDLLNRRKTRRFRSCGRHVDRLCFQRRWRGNFR